MGRQLPFRGVGNGFWRETWARKGYLGRREPYYAGAPNSKNSNTHNSVPRGGEVAIVAKPSPSHFGRMDLYWGYVCCGWLPARVAVGV